MPTTADIHKIDTLDKCDQYELKHATEWDPFKAPLREDLVIDGESYTRYIDSLAWLEAPKFDHPREVRDNGVEIGDWRFGHAKFPLYTWGSRFMFGSPQQMRATLSLGASESMYYDTSNQAKFTTPVYIPMLCTKQGNTWMSVTPMEMLTQRPGLRYAHGRVLVGGLGLGWFLHYCLLRKQVKHAVVVDKSEALIDYFRPRIEAIHGKDRVRFVHGDAYWVAENGRDRFDSVLFDIWEGYGESSYDKNWLTYLRNRPEGQRWWGWGTPRSVA